MKRIIWALCLVCCIGSIPLSAGKKKLMQANHKLTLAQERLQEAVSKESVLSKKLSEMSEVTVAERLAKEQVSLDLAVAIKAREDAHEKVEVLESEIQGLLDKVKEKEKEVLLLRQKQEQVTKKNKSISTKLEQAEAEHKKVLEEKQKQQREVIRLQEKLQRIEEERCLQEGVSKNKQKVLQDTLTQLKKKKREALEKNEQNEQLQKEIARIKEEMLEDQSVLTQQKKSAEVLAEDLNVRLALMQKVCKHEAKRIAELAEEADKKEKELEARKQSMESLALVYGKLRKGAISAYEDYFKLALAGDEFARKKLALELARVKDLLEYDRAEYYAFLLRIVSAGKDKVAQIIERGEKEQPLFSGLVDLPNLIKGLREGVKLITTELEVVQSQLAVYEKKADQDANLDSAFTAIASLLANIELKSQRSEAESALKMFWHNVRSKMFGLGKFKNPLRSNVKLTNIVLTGFLAKDFGLSSVYLPQSFSEASAFAPASDLSVE